MFDPLQKVYLADGVYAKYDNDAIWLEVIRGEDIHTIAIDREVWHKLKAHAEAIWKDKAL